MEVVCLGLRRHHHLRLVSHKPAWKEEERADYCSARFLPETEEAGEGLGLKPRTELQAQEQDLWLYLFVVARDLPRAEALAASAKAERTLQWAGIWTDN